MLETGAATIDLNELLAESALVQFDYGSVTLLLPLPASDFRPYEQAPLPALPHSPYPPHVPTITRITCLKDEKIAGRDEELELRYASKVVLPTPRNDAERDQAIAAVVAVRRALPSAGTAVVTVDDLEVPVRMRVVAPSGAVRADRDVRVVHAHQDGVGLALTVAAPEIGLRLRLVVREPGAGTCDVMWADPCELPARGAADQLRLRDVFGEARVIELRMLGSDAPLIWAQVSGAPVMTTPSATAREVAERLALIAERTGVDVRLPRERDEKGIRDRVGLERSRVRSIRGAQRAEL